MESWPEPLGSMNNFLAHIAIPNCVDYLLIIEKHRMIGDISSEAKLTEFRYAMNAVESLNNILEYRYHELEIRNTKLEQFKADFFHPAAPPIFISDIESLANAYKHKVRGRWDHSKQTFIINSNHKHASDMKPILVHFSAGMRVGSPLVDTKISFESIDIEATIRDSHDFWSEYIEKNN